MDLEGLSHLQGVILDYVYTTCVHVRERGKEALLLSENTAGVKAT